MSREIAEYPYNGYYLYRVYHKKENRFYAILYPIGNDKSKRTTISYARYLMSIKEGRILSQDEQVDHIDEDSTNDDINNLQILTPEENNNKNCATRHKKMVLLKCPYCNKIFSKERRNSYLVKGNSYSACSRRCASKFGSMLRQPDKRDYVKKQMEENLISEYYEPFV